LRLIEAPRQNLTQLPAIMDMLAERGASCLRFVIFIDDLSFETADASFTTLKMLLEGGVETRPANAVLYATSNRRHLVKERLAERPSSVRESGDMRASDSMQEQFSLADRFGLTVVFTAPNQDDFLRIAEHIATRRALPYTPQAFRENALRWERWFNGRSPRTAAQYVDWVATGARFPWEVKA
jgi:predicted AAA+ superfamily ATPase